MLAGCGDETAILIQTDFDDTLHPRAVGQLVLVVEPLDSPGFDGLGEVDSGDEPNEIRVRVMTVDYDGEQEVVFNVPAEAVDFASGKRFRLRPGPLPDDVSLRIVGLAADDDRRQVGGGLADADSRGREIRFRDGEEVLVELPLACFCAGGRGCTPFGPGEEPVHCPDEPQTEAWCGEGLNNDVSDLWEDCADSDCWHRPGVCELCGDEVCDRACEPVLGGDDPLPLGHPDTCDENCNGLRDCSDWQCVASDDCIGASPEICVGEEDEDRDGYIDCIDPDCFSARQCGCSVERPEVCDNYGDDDCDGLTDCQDPDCPADEWPEFERSCNDGFNDDCDGATDCFDSDCLVAPQCECPPGGDEICMDNYDSDCDGKPDCEDEDCDAEHVAESGPLCSDGVNNDCTGFSDCQDSNCISESARGVLLEICVDGRDNDCDSSIDCDDDDCAGAGGRENCFDFVDNDCDRAVDCADPDCVLNPEVCWNFRDDDCDLAWDCSDSDCAGVGVCEGTGPEICANGTDDDGDEWVDCSDEDCLDEPTCL